MNVLLIEPPFSPFDVPQGLVGIPEPLALESIAADVCQEHNVVILDMRIDNSLDNTLATFNPDIIGVGSVTANLHLAKSVLQKAKQFNSQMLTVIGGHHVTFLPQDAKESFVDLIVIGEGDVSFKQIVEAHANKQSFEKIPGIVINNNNEQIITAKPSLIDMNRLSVPARHLVEKYRSQYFQRIYRPIVSINTSRGCPFRCGFCSLWKLNNGKYRTRSAELVVNEIATFEEEFVDFIDDNTLEDIKRAHEIADLLINKNIRKKIKLYGRADTIAKNPDLIEKFAAAGLKLVLTGFESINDDKLAEWHKSSMMEMNLKAIRILQANNIDIAAYFVIDPQFDQSDFKALGDYVEQMNLSDPVFTILVPFPGTDLYDARKNDIEWKHFPLFDFFHTVFKTKLPLEEFYSEFSHLYKRAYSKKISGPDTKNVIFEKIFKRIHDLKEHHLNLAKL